MASGYLTVPSAAVQRPEPREEGKEKMAAGPVPLKIPPGRMAGKMPVSVLVLGLSVLKEKKTQSLQVKRIVLCKDGRRADAF